MRKENIKGHSPAFRKYAKNPQKYEVKLKKFSLSTYENHASSASRHHATGAWRRSRIPRDAKYRLPKKPGNRMMAIPAGACAGEHLGGHRGQSLSVFTGLCANGY
jgi:hypothetical protein